MSTLRQLRRIRWAVRATLTLGVAASVAANILHADPNPISQTISAWPPLALLLTVELISRIPVHRALLAMFRIIATAVIASIAAWVSYWHMAGVAARYGEVGASPYLLPLSVDGLIVVASISLVELATRIRHLETPPVTVPAPAPTPVPAPTPAAAAPAPSTDTAPAPRRPAATKTTAGKKNTSAKKSTAKRTASTTRTPSTTAETPAPAAHADPKQAPAPTTTATATPTPATPTTTATGTDTDDIAGLLPVARLIADSHHQATNQPITTAQLATRLRVATPTATRILAHLTGPDRPTPQPHNGTATPAQVPA